MVAAVSAQTMQNTLYVKDASADPDISFAPGELKKQAFYKLKGDSIADYILISVPYGVLGISPQFIPTGNYTLAPVHNNVTVLNNGYIGTINPITQVYQTAYTVAQKNEAATDGSIVIVGNTGWSYQVNDAAPVATTTGTNYTLTFTAGGTCTIIRKGSTNKFLIDGGVE